jgi:hypothetical protein
MYRCSSCALDPVATHTLTMGGLIEPSNSSMTGFGIGLNVNALRSRAKPPQVSYIRTITERTLCYRDALLLMCTGS